MIPLRKSDDLSSWVERSFGHVFATPELCHAALTHRSAGAEQQALARVRAAGLLVDTASYPDMLQRLEPDTAAGATFRHAAREMLALSAYRANDVAATRKWLDLIGSDFETPSSLRSRAEALLALLPPVAKS